MMKRREVVALLGGAAVARPLTARAQQPAMPVIGFLNSRSRQSFMATEAEFLKTPSEAGYIEGRTSRSRSLCRRRRRSAADTRSGTGPASSGADCGGWW